MHAYTYIHTIIQLDFDTSFHMNKSWVGLGQLQYQGLHLLVNEYAMKNSYTLGILITIVLPTVSGFTIPGGQAKPIALQSAPVNAHPTPTSSQNVAGENSKARTKTVAKAAKTTKSHPILHYAKAIGSHGILS